MTAVHRLIGCICLLAAGSVNARAQAVGEPAPGRAEVAVGMSWIGTSSFGSIDASLTGVAGDRIRLFSTSTELASAPAFDVRFGLRLSRLVQAELTASYSTPTMNTSISADAEGAASTVASDSLRQLTILGGAAVFLPRWQVGGRLLPFVTAGGGYLRQLHEGDTLAQSGRAYYVGGGGAIALSGRGRARRLKQIGVRIDGRALWRTGAVTLDGRVHASPVLTASLFARF